MQAHGWRNTKQPVPRRCRSPKDFGRHLLARVPQLQSDSIILLLHNCTCVFSMNKLIPDHKYNTKTHTVCSHFLHARLRFGKGSFLLPDSTRLRFGKGSFSLPDSTSSNSLEPLQLPLAGPFANDFTTRRACIFFWNCWTFGLSCVPPLWRWQPKKFSRGSCEILWLRKALTSGKVNTYSTNSMKEWAAWIQLNDHITETMNRNTNSYLSSSVQA